MQHARDRGMPPGNSGPTAGTGRLVSSVADFKPPILARRLDEIRYNWLNFLLLCPICSCITSAVEQRTPSERLSPVGAVKCWSYDAVMLEL